MATDVLKEEYTDLQEETDGYKKLIMQQKHRLVSLDKEITEAENDIQEKFTFPGGILKEKGKYCHLRKHILILETKLNQDKVKFNELLCRNMHWHKDIAHLQQQKGIACSIKKKFDKRLAALQSVMEKLDERLDLTLNTCSEAEKQMQEARDSIKAETAQFTKRELQLKTVIDHDSKLHTFMERKLHDIIPVQEDSKKRKAEQHYQSGVKELEMYKQGHSRLVEVTGKTDLRQIAHMFIQGEQKNFAHVNFINELHNRRSALKSRSEKMKSDILLLAQENKGHDEQSTNQLEDLESELEKYSCLADSLEKQCIAVQSSLDQLKTAISGLLEEAMQEAAAVTSDNIARFISILEESVSNMLIQANDLDEEQMEMPPQNLLLANSELLPDIEAGGKRESSTSSSRSRTA